MREVPLREEGWRLLALAPVRSPAGRPTSLADAAGRAATAVRRARHRPGPAAGRARTGRARPVGGRAGRCRSAPPSTRPRAGRPRRPSRRTPRGFVGRSAELDALDRAAAAARPGTAGRGARRRRRRQRQVGAARPRSASDLDATGWTTVVGRCPESEGAPPAWAWSEALRDARRRRRPGPVCAPSSPRCCPTRRRRPTAQVTRSPAGSSCTGPCTTGCPRSATARSRCCSTTRTAPTPRPARCSQPCSTTASPPGCCSCSPTGPEPRRRAGRAARRRRAARPAAAAARGPRRRRTAPNSSRPSPGRNRTEAVLAALADRTDGNPVLPERERAPARQRGRAGRDVAGARGRRGRAAPPLRPAARRNRSRCCGSRPSVGRDVDVDVLVRAAELDEDAVLDALETGPGQRPALEPDAEHVRFSHLLVRETLYSGVSQLRRLRWHARLADAVAELYPADLAALAHHSARSATPASAAEAADRASPPPSSPGARFAYDARRELYARGLPLPAARERAGRRANGRGALAPGAGTDLVGRHPARRARPGRGGAPRGGQ